MYATGGGSRLNTVSGTQPYCAYCISLTLTELYNPIGDYASLY
jgi:hypothetical protein